MRQAHEKSGRPTGRPARGSMTRSMRPGIRGGSRLREATRKLATSRRSTSRPRALVLHAYPSTSTTVEVIGQANGECPKQSAEGPPDDFRRASSQREPLSPQAERYILATCGGRATVGDTVYAGHIRFSEIVSLLARFVGGTVVDRTGLQGLFSSTEIRAAGDGCARAGRTAVDLYGGAGTAGLKLDATTVEAQVLIVDRIERPTTN